VSRACFPTPAVSLHTELVV
jgi:hypothetical protein